MGFHQTSTKKLIPLERITNLLMEIKDCLNRLFQVSLFALPCKCQKKPLKWDARPIVNH
jgi:hypothetical protein